MAVSKRKSSDDINLGTYEASNMMATLEGIQQIQRYLTRCREVVVK